MTTSHTSKLLPLLLALLLGLATPALATRGIDPEAPVARELNNLAMSIDNLARLLTEESRANSEETRLRKLDIAISYLNFRSRRIEMFERELQTTRATRNRLEDVLEQFYREEESLTQMFDGNQDATKRAREELDLRRQVVKGRIDRMDEELILLENRIMDMQSQIDSVESFVQKNLEF